MTKQYQCIAIMTCLTASAAAACGADIAKDYQSAADRIISATRKGNQGYAKLTELCDDIGNRIGGSDALDKAVHWAADTLRADGQENVRLETVMLPKWVRGEESAVMLAPRKQPLAMLGLGYSVGTPPGGITAPVVVVDDEKQLDELGDAARGKIVLFNNPMPAYTPEGGTGYGRTVRFRTNGARLASEQGAVACLVRSVTAVSLWSPHTGAMRYGDAKVRIPAAAISTEDTDMIARFQKRGIPVMVRLEMDAQTHAEVPSANVIAELRGSSHPDEIVVISGHIDSWDVGQGANDDGAGCIMAMEALNVLRKLGLRPKRTIRVVLWTGEEIGLFGAKSYAETHESELPRHVAAIEADVGSFAPTGYSIDCEDAERLHRAADQLRQMIKLCSPLGDLSVREDGSAADVSQMKPAGVVVMGHETDPSRYFNFHHTHADTLDKIKPQDLTDNIAMMAVTAYIIADLPDRFGQ